MLNFSDLGAKQGQLGVYALAKRDKLKDQCSEKQHARNHRTKASAFNWRRKTSPPWSWLQAYVYSILHSPGYVWIPSSRCDEMMRY